MFRQQQGGATMKKVKDKERADPVKSKKPETPLVGAGELNVTNKIWQVNSSKCRSNLTPDQWHAVNIVIIWLSSFYGPYAKLRKLIGCLTVRDFTIFNRSKTLFTLDM